MKGRRSGPWLAAWLLLALGFGSPQAWAHKTSDSYPHLEAKSGEWVGQWSLALHDLEYAVGLDTNGDGAITWGELKARPEAVVAYARDRLVVQGGGRPLLAAVWMLRRARGA